jgi:hypothetical protein
MKTTNKYFTGNLDSMIERKQWENSKLIGHTKSYTKVMFTTIIENLGK